MSIMRYALFLSALFILEVSVFAQVDTVEFDVRDEPFYYNLKKALRNKEEVYKLKLSAQELNEFPSEILELTALRYLLLDSNGIRELPDSIGKLENLELLSLSYNKLTSLPNSIGDMDNLKYLDLDNNEIESFPNRFFLLRNLQMLYFSNNRFNEFSTDFMKLKELHTLVCSGNRLTQIPEEIGHLYNMESLSFSDNQLTDLPERLFDLKKMKFLYVSENQLNRLSSDIKKLKDLEILSLNKNQLESLPEELGELQLLERLFVSENQLKSFPQRIHNMVNLKILTIEQNPFEPFPNQLVDLKKIESIYLKGVQLDPFPQALYDLHNRGVNIYGLESKELYETKLLASRAKNKRITKDYDASVENYKALLAMDTNNVEGFIGLSQTYLEMNAFKEAEATCYKAFSKNPNESQVSSLNVLIEDSKEGRNQSTKMVKTYEERLLENPNDASPYFELGQKFYFNKDYSNAQTYFIKALKIDDNHAQTHLYLALTALCQDKDEAFEYAILRYYTLEHSSKSVETSLPFLFSRFKMNTGVKDKKGSTSYYDEYIVRDDNGRILYKSASPQSDLLVTMLMDIFKGDVVIIDSSGDGEIGSLALEEIFHANVSNDAIFRAEYEKLLESDVDFDQDEVLYLSYYKPFFQALNEAGHLTAFSYYISGLREEADRDITKWLKEHQAAIDSMNQWIDSYEWNSDAINKD